MMLQDTVEHSQASLRHQTQGRVRTGRLGLRRHGIAQGRTDSVLQERVAVGHRSDRHICNAEYLLLAGRRPGLFRMAFGTQTDFTGGRHLLHCKIRATTRLNRRLAAQGSRRSPKHK